MFHLSGAWDARHDQTAGPRDGPTNAVCLY